MCVCFRTLYTPNALDLSLSFLSSRVALVLLTSNPSSFVIDKESEIESSSSTGKESSALRLVLLRRRRRRRLVVEEEQEEQEERRRRRRTKSTTTTATNYRQKEQRHERPRADSIGGPVEEFCEEQQRGKERVDVVNWTPREE